MRSANTLSALAISFVLGYFLFFEGKIDKEFGLLILPLSVCAITCFWTIFSRRILYNPILLACLFFACSSILSLFSWVDPYSTSLFVFRSFSLFFVVYLGFSLVQEEAGKRILVGAISLLACAVIIPSVIVYLVAYGISSSDHYLIGPLLWYNHMANFILLTAPVVLSLLFSQSNRYFKAGVALISIFFFIGLLFTFSRAAWLSAILGSIFLLFFWYKRQHEKKNLLFKKKKTIYLATSFIILSILVFLSMSNMPLVERARSIPGELFSSNRSTSGNLRLEAYRVGLSIFRSYPLVGSGVGTYGLLYGHFQNVPWLYTTDAHNIFIQILAEQGSVGLLTFIILGILLISLIIRVRKRLDPLTIGLLFSLGLSFFHNLFDTSLMQTSLAILFWLEWGMLVGILGPVKTLKNSKILLFMPVFLFAISLYFFYIHYLYENAQKAGRNKNFGDAQISIERVINLCPWRDDYWRFLGSVRWLQKDPMSAQRYYQKALQLNPYATENYLRLAEVMTARGELESAQKILEQSIKVKQFADMKSYLGLSQIYLKQDNPRQAEKLLALAISERFPLNQSYYDRLHDYKIVGWDKELGDMYETLAGIYEQKGDTGTAKNIKEKESKIYIAH